MSDTANLRQNFARDGFVVVPPGVVFTDAEVARISEIAGEALPRWEDGAVDPSRNDSNTDPRFDYAVDLDGHVHLRGVALRHRFHRGHGSVISSLDDNYLYGKRASIEERYWPSALYPFVENSRLRADASALLGCGDIVFRAGSAAVTFPAFAGDSRQYRISTPAFLPEASDPLPKKKFVLEAIVFLDDADAHTASLRVIPGSHLRYEEINAHVAGRLGQPASRNHIPAARSIWEELLPDGLGAPVEVTARKGSVVFLHSNLLRGVTPNDSDGAAGKSLALAFACRTDSEFLRSVSLDREGCSRVYAGVSDKKLVDATFLPGARRISGARLRRITGAIDRFVKGGWKAPIRPVYYGLKNLTKRRNKPLDQKQYLNIGAGVAWRHPEVICLDHDLPNAEVALDLNYRAPLPFPDARFDGVYTSHCMEHLKESQVKWWVKEVLRTLRPGGVFRVTSPDIKGYLDAYELRDGKYFDWIQGRAMYQFDSWLRLIVRMFAEPVVDNYSDDELYALYASMPREEFVEHFNSQVERITDERFLNPSCHKSWWSGERMRSVMLEAGFSKAHVKKQHESECEVFEEKAFFNRTRPSMSFYTDGIK